MLKVGISLSIVGLLVVIIALILSILYIWRHSAELPANLVIGFMLGQIFFNMGIMFYPCYIQSRLK